MVRCYRVRGANWGPEHLCSGVRHRLADWSSLKTFGRTGSPKPRRNSALFRNGANAPTALSGLNQAAVRRIEACSMTQVPKLSREEQIGNLPLDWPLNCFAAASELKLRAHFTANLRRKMRKSCDLADLPRSRSRSDPSRWKPQFADRLRLPIRVLTVSTIGTLPDLAIEASTAQISGREQTSGNGRTNLLLRRSP